MNILEVRDSFIKFEADSDIYLSAFIQIKGHEKDYVAQVTQLNKNSEGIVGYAKILFLLTSEGLQNYDMTLPPEDSEIVEFTSDILCNSINAAEPIIAGKTLNKELNITIDYSAFNKKMLVCAESDNTNNIIVNNLTKQFRNLGKKVIVIDTLGIIDAHKYVAGIDFKLPLNTDSLAFMYKDCLNEATADSKSLIVEIFKDLSEYSKTVPFVPFETLRTIVNNMVDSSHIFKLFVLKTKLNKLSLLKYFADNYRDVSIDKILSDEYVVFDLSKLDAPFQNQYLKYIYSSIKDTETQVILELSNSITKQSIKSIYLNEQIATTFVSNSDFKYINDIKNIFDNFIIEPSSVNNKVFDIYSTFLNAMSDSSYLIAGEATNYIPLVSLLTEIDDMPLIEKHLSEANNISYPESDVSNKNVNTAEIMASIDEKSENAIEEVTESLKTPNKLNLFDDESDNTNEQATEPEKSYENSTNDELTAEEDIDDSDSEELIKMPEVADDLNSVNENIKENNILEELENENKGVLTEENTYNNEENEEHVEYETVVTQNISEEPEEAEQKDNVEIETTSEEMQDLTSEYTEQKDKFVNTDSTEIKDESEEETEIIVEEADETEEVITEGAETAEEPETSIIIDNEIDLDLEENDKELQNDNFEDITETLDAELTKEENIYEVNEAVDSTDEVIPVTENDDSELEEIVELDANNIQEDDIIVDMGDSLNEFSDSADEQIIKDVDKVFTTRKDDDITDTDLDFIDELNNEEIILEDTESDDLLEEENSEGEIIQEGSIYQDEDEKEDTINSEILEKRDASTPIVPVYDAEIPQEDLVISDPIQQGDAVIHAKYGSGVVEKMIKYGNKTLFAINFDNVGRRLLDPTLTEIKKS